MKHLGFIVFLCSVFTMSVFSVWQHVSMINLGYAITIEKNRSDELVNENRRHRLTLATIFKNRHLEEEGKKLFNLKDPQSHQVVYVMGGKVITPPKVALQSWQFNSVKL